MAHTPSFSKKINESLLQVKRKQDDQLYCVDQKYDVLAPVRGILDQETAQQLVYLDFYHRIQANYYSLPVYIAPSYMSHHTMVHAFLQQYEADYQRVCSQLDRLAVLHTPYHLYHPCVIEALEQLDAKMFADHRAGVRADVVHYDIQTGRVAPDHHIQYIEEEQSQYIVRFFLNGSKDTLSGAIDYPYDVFGCVALLVNPHDKRYKKARGKEVILPITNRSVPVIPYEGVSIEGLGTRVLVPAHNREDFKIALELGLPVDIYAFDKFGCFTEYAKDFAHKSLLEFSENVIKFLDDISNLESTHLIKKLLPINKYTKQRLYPLLEKNIYIGLGYQSAQDTNFIAPVTQHIGNVSNLLGDLEHEENFCISNQNKYQPAVASFAGTVVAEQGMQENNLIEDIVKTLYQLGLLHLPARGDDILDALTLQYDGHYLWKTIYTFHTMRMHYEQSQQVYDLLMQLSEDIPNDATIDEILDAIDLGTFFVHTKQGYIAQTQHNYHYDTDYLTVALMVNLLPDAQMQIVFFEDTTTYFKYFLYLHYFYYRKSLQAHLYALEKKTISRQDWANCASLSGDVMRMLLLQACHHAGEDECEHSYTAIELERFLQKRWNLARIVPVEANRSLQEIAHEITKQAPHMHDYDRYIISLVHELYDEVCFLLKKRATDQIMHIVISTLWDKLSDTLLYILKKKPSPVSDQVAFYVLYFAHHLLYPMMPTTIIGIFEATQLQRMVNFFTEDVRFSINKNIKCNFLMQFITSWYQALKTHENIQGFVLKANKDFLDYAREVLPDFQDLLGKEYCIELLDEHQLWPDGVEINKIFAMQWGIVYQSSYAGEENIPTPQLQDSLGTLKKQLSYKQQLLQTLKNTLMRARQGADRTKVEHFQQQIASIEQDIIDLEYQISKLKYF